MSVRKKIPYKHGSFFITITNASWLPLFEQSNTYDVVYNWFDYFKSKGHYVNAFVIMPNHLHAIISFSHSEQTINTIIGNGKRFMAYEIVKRMKEQKLDDTLYALRTMVHKTDEKRGKKHEVFEPSFDWKLLETTNFIAQKLNYIHTNPIRGLEPLCIHTEDYIHSSALQYGKGSNANRYRIKSIYEMEDVNLSGGQL